MYTAISIIIVIASVFLTIIVLIQNSKDGGLAANFAARNQTFGFRQTADFLEKATWTLAFTILFLSVVATAFISTRFNGNKSNLMEKVEQSVPAQGVPQFPVDSKTVNPAQQTSGEQNAVPAQQKKNDSEKSSEK